MARDNEGCVMLHRLLARVKIQFLGHREEIPQLMHFHDDLTGMVQGGAHVTIESMAAELANARTACA
jgi:hypothetical protein